MNQCKKQRCFVTGLGIISPLGNDVASFWNNCINGNSGIRRIDKFDTTSFPVHIGGQVNQFDPLDWMQKKWTLHFDPFSHYALAATHQAMQDASLLGKHLTQTDKSRIGVIVGSGIGGIRNNTYNNLQFDQGGWRKVSPYFIPSSITNISSALIAIQHGLRGVNYSISTACASSNHAILASFHHIARGEADIMVCGGSEAALTPFGLSGFCATRALSTRNENPEKASRPFDTDRNGFVLSEGSGILILESEDSVYQRDAHVYAEMLGGAMTCDAYHVTAPRNDSLSIIECMQNALHYSDVDGVDYINAHGTSTILGDKAEQIAIKCVFGEKASEIKINSTKSMIGHLLGASGAVEAIALIKTLNTQQVHPTINLDNPDPDCNLNYVPNKSIHADVDIAMSNSFGFGGHNSSLIFKRGIHSVVK